MPKKPAKDQNKPISLSAARKSGEVELFIKEREAEIGDMDKLDATIKKSVQTSSKAPKASSRDESDD